MTASALMMAAALKDKSGMTLIACANVPTGATAPTIKHGMRKHAPVPALMSSANAGQGRNGIHTSASAPAQSQPQTAPRAILGTSPRVRAPASTKLTALTIKDGMTTLANVCACKRKNAMVTRLGMTSPVAVNAMCKTDHVLTPTTTGATKPVNVHAQRRWIVQTTRYGMRARVSVVVPATLPALVIKYGTESIVSVHVSMTTSVVMVTYSSTTPPVNVAVQRRTSVLMVINGTLSCVTVWRAVLTLQHGIANAASSNVQQPRPLAREGNPMTTSPVSAAALRASTVPMDRSGTTTYASAPVLRRTKKLLARAAPTTPHTMTITVNVAAQKCWSVQQIRPGMTKNACASVPNRRTALTAKSGMKMPAFAGALRTSLVPTIRFWTGRAASVAVPTSLAPHPSNWTSSVSASVHNRTAPLARNGAMSFVSVCVMSSHAMQASTMTRRSALVLLRYQNVLKPTTWVSAGQEPAVAVLSNHCNAGEYIHV